MSIFSEAKSTAFRIAGSTSVWVEAEEQIIEELEGVLSEGDLEFLLDEVYNGYEWTDEDPDDDGQPTEYEEWQDYMGGDDDPADYMEYV